MDCLLTKLKGTVSDTDLLKLGELRLDFRNDGGWEQVPKGFSIKTEKECTITIIGTGNFTNSTYSTNNGKSITINANTETNVYVSGDTDGFISIPDKYGLLQINLGKGGIKTKVNFYGGLSALEYCNKLERLYLRYLKYVEGDIKYLSGKPLISVEISSQKVYGDIACFADNTNLYDLIFDYNMPIYGDISSLAGCSMLHNVHLHGEKITGDISSLPKSLVTIDLNSTSTSGDISIFNDNSELITLILINTNVAGSINGLKCPLTTLSLGSSITGSIESLINTQRSAGRSSGNFALDVSLNNNITFNSTEIKQKKCNVSWTSSQITVGDETIDA